ncbi:LuxR C-terminal-related transcriptional regulator [Microbacterium sp. ZW T6_19]|uniref:LuxR C-terminal-related transcriptional regulator n=1 Tax=Microbacterium sp. ZW T6_19 TaxID=3378082 RepID=UPI0038544340
MTIGSPSDHGARAPIPAALIASLPDTVPDDVLSALRLGDPGAALRAALDGHDLSSATDVLRIAWFDLLRDDHLHESRTALEKLPAAALTSHPLLAMALGILLNADGLRRTKAAYYFGLASLGIRSWTERTPASERALVLSSESAALRLMGKSALSVRSARAGVAALEEIRDDRAALIGYLPRLYSQLGASLYYGGAETTALQVFARGYAEFGEADVSSFSSLSMMAGIHALRGNMTEAASFVAIARGEPWTDEQRAMYTGTFYRLAEALLALERFDTGMAAQHLAAMRHDRRSIEHWVAIGRVEAMTGLFAGDPAGALARLEELVVLRGSEGQAAANRSRLVTIRSVLHLALGNHEAAATVLRRDAGRTPQDHVDRARVALATGATSDALRHLRAIAGRTQSTRTLAQALTLESAIALRAGSGRRTDVLLRQLISTIRQSQQRTALRLVPPEDSALLSEALTRMGAADLAEIGEIGSLLAEPDRPRLTSRERAVLEVLVRSGSRSAIAAELFVSPNTVKTHMKSLYRKLGARTREEALTIAMHRRLISPTSLDTLS